MNNLKGCLLFLVFAVGMVGVAYGLIIFVHWIDYQMALEGCNNSMPYDAECTCKEGFWTIVCSKHVETSNSWTTNTKIRDINEWGSWE